MQQSLNLDAILEFVADRVGDDELYRFQDISTALNWLLSEEALFYRQDNSIPIESKSISDSIIISAETKLHIDTTMCEVLKPGTKITIRKPSANDIKFNDLESVQAYLSQASSSQSNEDSDEVDVTTLDYTPAWNQYHNVETAIKATNTANVVIVKKPKSSGNLYSSMEEEPNISSDSNSPGIKMLEIELKFQCPECDRKYKQRSSLLRHGKLHKLKETGIEPTKKPPITQKRSSKNKTNGIVPVKSGEPIST